MAQGAATSTVATSDRPLVRISRVASRYLIFDIEDVMFLRRHHNLCSVFSGTVPQNPQQNVFMGLPVELMAEEARALVEDGAAYVVEDADFHIRMLKDLTKKMSIGAKKAEVDIAASDGDDIYERRDEYISNITEEGTAVMQAHIDEKQALREASLMKASRGKRSKKGKLAAANVNEKDDLGSQADEVASTTSPVIELARDDADEGLFGSSSVPHERKIDKKNLATSSVPYAVTPTTTGSLLLGTSPSRPSSSSVEVDVPPSYSLFKHLHDKGYYMMPGLRFGCDYNVYPGDPLRFHAHFQATSYDWDEEINMMDLTAGGRLGTGVKKGWLVGGQPAKDEGKAARAFCLEWAGM
ncbi:tRNA-splicing endonuclease subunit Sen34 [Microdochium nivale]|nr:tRNA-splicing endonuclease subunit Sen34 [Microdochium nivale]